MSWDVYVWVVAPCDGEIAPKIAQRFLESNPRPTPESVRYSREPEQVYRMIKDIASGKAVFPGPKGNLILWGCAWNYASVERFIQAALPFWHALWMDGKDEDAAIFSFENILVFSESEQQAHRTTYEVTSAGKVFLRQDTDTHSDKDFWLCRETELQEWERLELPEEEA